MKENFKNLTKETRCYIMSAILYFEGFNPPDAMTDINCDMLIDSLGLTRDDMERFPIPDFSLVISKLKPISDSKVRDWIITNIYSPVLKSRKAEALIAFKHFCSHLMWDPNEINESVELTEALLGIKPVNINSTTNASTTGKITSANNNISSGSGCLLVCGLFIVCSVLLSYLLM